MHGKLSCLMINDLDAGIGHFENTQVGGCCCGECFLGRAAIWGAFVGNALQVGTATRNAHQDGVRWEVRSRSGRCCGGE